MIRVLASLLLLICPIVFAAPVVVRDDTSSIAVGRSTAFFEDKEGTRTIDDILAPDSSIVFKASEKDTLSFGLTQSVYWIRFSIHNGSTQSGWMLELAYPPMQQVDVTVVTPGGKTTQPLRGGANIPIEQRPSKHRNHVFPLLLDTGSTADIYLRVSSEGSKIIPLTLWNPDALNRHDVEQVYIASCFMGTVVVLVFYNLCLFLLMRETMYLFYVVFLGSMAGFFLSLTGFGQEFVWGKHPGLNSRLTPFFMNLLVIGGAGFCTRFLGITDSKKTINQTLRKLPYFSLLIIILIWFIPYHVSIVISIFFPMTLVILIIVTAAQEHYQGNPIAKYFLISWAGLIFGITSLWLRAVNIIPNNAWTEYGIFWGAAIESLFLNFAIAERTRWQFNERNNHQNQLIEESKRLATNLRNENERITQAIIERSDELSSMREVISEQQKTSARQLVMAGVGSGIEKANSHITLSLRHSVQRLDGFEDYLRELASDDRELTAEFSAWFSRFRKQIAIIEDGTRRIGGIMNRLSPGRESRDTDSEQSCPITILMPLLRELQQSHPDIAFVRRLDSDTECRMGSTDLQESLTALLDNAIRAIRDKHPLRDEGCVEVGLHVLTRDGHDVLEISIQDNGIGMKDTVLQQAFDPFFTTRAVGSGAGLGLSTSKELIERAHGSITLSSVLEAGTRVQILLPVLRGA